MISLFEILNKKTFTRACGFAIVSGAVCMMSMDTFAANVVARPTASTQTASRAQPNGRSAAVRMPTMTANVASANQTVAATVEKTPEPEPVVETQVTEPTFDVKNKSSVFGSSLSSSSSSSSDVDASVSNLAELVRAQRAALDAADAVAATTAAANTISAGGENACDTALRECMIARCGNNFVKCNSDTDTAFNDKLDTCRRSTKCTGHEYQLFAPEILADRNMNIQLTEYNAVIECGTKYDACIVSECGTTYSKCIGKSAGDTAIARCDSIAKSCVKQDSGLAMRAMGIFGELRQDAERQISVDEKRLYALRDQMKDLCLRLGAMFDERSLDCVYTVNFYAGDDSTLYASKKAYAGSTFDCTQNWFGIDITTFRENAFRATRAQTAASSAMLGAGVGTAVGAVTSGAITNAVNRFTAENARDEAKCKEDATKKWSKFLNKCIPINAKEDDEIEGAQNNTVPEWADDSDESVQRAETSLAIAEIESTAAEQFDGQDEEIDQILKQQAAETDAELEKQLTEEEEKLNAEIDDELQETMDGVTKRAVSGDTTNLDRGDVKLEKLDYNFQDPSLKSLPTAAQPAQAASQRNSLALEPVKPIAPAQAEAPKGSLARPNSSASSSSSASGTQQRNNSLALEPVKPIAPAQAEAPKGSLARPNSTTSSTSTLGSVQTDATVGAEFDYNTYVNNIDTSNSEYQEKYDRAIASLKLINARSQKYYCDNMVVDCTEFAQAKKKLSDCWPKSFQECWARGSVTIGTAYENNNRNN